MSNQPGNVEYRVRRALLDDPRTRDATIEVLNQNGVITLLGTTASLRASEAAEEVARQVEGVVQVINQLNP